MSGLRKAGSYDLRIGDEVAPRGWDLDGPQSYGRVVGIKEGVHGAPAFYRIKVHNIEKVEPWQEEYVKLWKDDGGLVDHTIEKLEELVCKRKEAFDTAETELAEAESALALVKSLS